MDKCFFITIILLWSSVVHGDNIQRFSCKERYLSFLSLKYEPNAKMEVKDDPSSKGDKYTLVLLLGGNGKALITSELGTTELTQINPSQFLEGNSILWTLRTDANGISLSQQKNYSLFNRTFIVTYVYQCFKE